MNKSIPFRRWLMLCTAGMAMLQAVVVIRVITVSHNILQQTSLIAPLEILTGVFWGVAFAFAAFSLAKHKPYGLRYSLWVLLSFMLYSVTRLVLFAEADYDRQRLPFLLVVALVIITIPLIIQWYSRWLRNR